MWANGCLLKQKKKMHNKKIEALEDGTVFVNVFAEGKY